MGQVQPNQQKFLKDWVKYGTEESRIFNCEIDVYENKNGDPNQRVAVVQRIYQSDVYYHNELIRLDQYRNLKINGLLQLLDVDKVEESALCSNIYRIISVYEYGTKITLSLQEFVQQTIHILLELQSKDMYHEDLRPYSFCQTDQVKLLLPLISQYNRFLSGFEEDCYLAPELFNQLGRRNHKPNYNKEKSEVYTFGLVCLEMELKQSIQDIYNFDDFIINQQLLDRYIKRVNNKLIKWMLQAKPDDRPKFSQIYEASIVMMVQPDDVQVPPLKLNIPSTSQYSSNLQSSQQSQYSSHLQSSSHLYVQPQMIEQKQIQQIVPQIVQPQVIKHTFQQSQTDINEQKMQYLQISQSPNNRYASNSSSISQKVQPEYAFLHEQQHMPFNPGNDFLESSRQTSKEKQFQKTVGNSPSIDCTSKPKINQSKRPSSVLRDISKNLNNTTSNFNTNNTVKEKQQNQTNSQISQNKKPALLKSRPSNNDMRSKSPMMKNQNQTQNQQIKTQKQKKK
ncbi:hypothetical protein pb186bvf_003461 [Paramecium bursaria]